MSAAVVALVVKMMKSVVVIFAVKVESSVVMGLVAIQTPIALVGLFASLVQRIRSHV